LPAWFVGEWPVGITGQWSVRAGGFGTAGHVLWTRALKLADASLLTPISFIQVAIVAVYGYFLFGEKVDRWTVLGAGIIFASNMYIARRETLLARRATTDPDIGGDSQSPR
jgi:drug/metabolite transporter (DMT)-like permease